MSHIHLTAKLPYARDVLRRFTKLAAGGKKGYSRQCERRIKTWPLNVMIPKIQVDKFITLIGKLYHSKSSNTSYNARATWWKTCRNPRSIDRSQDFSRTGSWGIHRPHIIFSTLTQSVDCNFYGWHAQTTSLGSNSSSAGLQKTIYTKGRSIGKIFVTTQLAHFNHVSQSRVTYTRSRTCVAATFKCRTLDQLFRVMQL